MTAARRDSPSLGAEERAVVHGVCGGVPPHGLFAAALGTAGGHARARDSGGRELFGPSELFYPKYRRRSDAAGIAQVLTSNSKATVSVLYWYGNVQFLRKLINFWNTLRRNPQLFLCAM